MTTKHIQNALRKAAAQKETVSLETTEDGVELSVRVMSTTTFAQLFIPLSNGQMSQLASVWFCSLPVELQQHHIELLTRLHKTREEREPSHEH